jgi:hypothetical protein|tara:strand:+ start:257 stop:529 length:273 start_codon:yes stop_codon:yes gene_type:complete
MPRELNTEQKAVLDSAMKEHYLKTNKYIRGCLELPLDIFNKVMSLNPMEHIFQLIDAHLWDRTHNTKFTNELKKTFQLGEGKLYVNEVKE